MTTLLDRIAALPPMPCPEGEVWESPWLGWETAKPLTWQRSPSAIASVRVTTAFTVKFEHFVDGTIHFDCSATRPTLEAAWNAVRAAVEAVMALEGEKE